MCTSLFSFYLPNVGVLQQRSLPLSFLYTVKLSLNKSVTPGMSAFLFTRLWQFIISMPIGGVFRCRLFRVVLSNFWFGRVCVYGGGGGRGL